MTPHDLDWLSNERPEPTPLDPRATERARRALLAHTHATPVVAVSPAPAIRSTRSAARRRRRTWRVTAGAGVAAVLVATLAIGGGWFGSSTREASATPLARLVKHVRTSPAPTGDATLVLRHRTYPNRAPDDGADLYTDDGRYFYSDTKEGLPAVVAGNQELGQGWIPRLEAAAVAALHLPIEQGRQGMSTANLDPTTTTSPADAQELARVLELKKKLASASTLPPLTPEEHENNGIWSNSMDAIIAGAGRPDVKAGVLRLLDTLPTVSVTRTVTDGTPTLTLRNDRLLSDGYYEELVVDADTGAPVRFTGGYPGKTPDVVVTYSVTRIDVASLTQG